MVHKSVVTKPVLLVHIIVMSLFGKRLMLATSSKIFTLVRNNFIIYSFLFLLDLYNNYIRLKHFIIWLWILTFALFFTFSIHYHHNLTCFFFFVTMIGACLELLSLLSHVDTRLLHSQAF